MRSTGLTVLVLVCLAGPYDQSFSIQSTIEPGAVVTEGTGAVHEEDNSAADRRLTMRQKRMFVLGLAAQEKK